MTEVSQYINQKQSAGTDTLVAKDSLNLLHFFRIDSEPYGLTFAEWTAKWWKWLLEQPTDSNPAIDDTGKNCAKNQNDPNVWFLAGTFGGKAERTCTIPEGKAILVSPINYICSFAQDTDCKTEAELIARAKSEMDIITRMNVVTDGTRVTSLKDYRIRSPLFNLRFPENNVLRVAPGETQAISDGYWIFLLPLAPGKHDIYSFGSCMAGKIKIEVTYHLIVG